MKSNRVWVFLLCSLAILWALSFPAQPLFAGEPGEDNLPPGNWRAAAEKEKISEEDINRLAENKILISNHAYKQVFTPYLEGDLPVFITSDSLLNAYHVLYEESIMRLERANSRKLPAMLKKLWEGLDKTERRLKGEPKLIGSAGKRARIVIGVALKLVNDKFEPTGETGEIILAEVKKVKEAKGRAMPAWMGKPEPGFLGIDYSRYQPRGFYTKFSRLRRYFQAVSWLQSIPFRVDRDEEFLAILMLGSCIEDIEDENFTRGNNLLLFFKGFKDFIGQGDDLDLLMARHLCFGGDCSKSMPYLRKQAYKEAEKMGQWGRINDSYRFPPDAGEGKNEGLSFRVISACRIPEAILFQVTTDQKKFNRAFPTGLEVCAALGSKWALKELSVVRNGKLVEEVEKRRDLFRGKSLYFEYLNCLSALLDEPEPDAPDFMKGIPWQIKSCYTVLAGWAQLRHTFALQAKQTAMYAGMSEIPPGFVEPEPEFYARMTGLASRTREILEKAGVFEENKADVADEIRILAEIVKTKSAGKGNVYLYDFLGRTQVHRVENIQQMLDLKTKDESSPEFRRELTAGLLKLADDYEAGKIKKTSINGNTSFDPLQSYGVDLKGPWENFNNLCCKLESLSHKQLRGAPVNNEDKEFMGEYGRILAGIMLYGGNSYLTPNDDAPRVVDVFTNPNMDQVLEVGAARARGIYVLYTFKGKEILCYGAVMPYYQFPSSTRLTDEQWLQKLDSKERPAVPSWVKPIVEEDGLSSPGWKER